ncbi:hypothetical protein INR49_009579 [Caranx melampygus]|nr:hypothetical protein INR49_009579 [Caranx melampygus]
METSTTRRERKQHEAETSHQDLRDGGIWYPGGVDNPATLTPSPTHTHHPGGTSCRLPVDAHVAC